MAEVKLLTEAEARAIYLAATSPDDFNRRLIERGLIAPEPESDPLELEAVAIAQQWREGNLNGPIEAGGADNVAYAALRRGMELAKPELTREMVREAVRTAMKSNARMLGSSDFCEQALPDDKRNMDGFLTRLHAALTEQVRK